MSLWVMAKFLRSNDAHMSSFPFVNTSENTVWSTHRPPNSNAWTTAPYSNTNNGTGGEPPDDLLAIVGHASLVLILGSLCIFTVLGNCLVLLAVIKNKTLQNPTGYFVSSLAISDLLVGSSVMPFNVLQQITGNVWPLGLTVCDIWHCIDVMACTASIWNLSVIGIDRYLANRDPLSYGEHLSRKHIAVAITAVWLLSAGLSLPAPTLWWRVRSPHLYADPNVCFFNNDPYYTAFSSLVSFYIPLCVIIGAYWRVYVIASQYTRALRSGTREIKRKITRKYEIDVSGDASRYYDGDNTVVLPPKDEPLVLRVHKGGPSVVGVDSSPLKNSCNGALRKKVSTLSAPRENCYGRMGSPPVGDPSDFRTTSPSLGARPTFEAHSQQQHTSSPLGDFDEQDDVSSRSSLMPPSPVKRKSGIPAVNGSETVLKTIERLADRAPSDAEQAIAQQILRRWSELRQSGSGEENDIGNGEQSVWDSGPGTPTSIKTGSRIRTGGTKSALMKHRRATTLTLEEALKNDDDLEQQSPVPGTPTSLRVAMPKLSIAATHFVQRSLSAVQSVKGQRAARTLSIVVGCFVVCWTPFFLFNIVTVIFPSDHISLLGMNTDQLYLCVTWLGHINSALNPLIYSRFSRDFRRAFKELLGCGGAAQRRRRRRRTRAADSRTMPTTIGLNRMICAPLRLALDDTRIAEPPRNTSREQRRWLRAIIHNKTSRINV